METLEQTIKKGSIVESRKDGWQGIVTSITPTLWASIPGQEGPHPDTIREYMASQNPPITDNEATTQRWVQASDFSCMGFTAPESDLVVIPASRIRFKDYPCAFAGQLAYIEQQSELGAVLLILRTNLTRTTICKDYINGLFIENATVVPMVGDAICGTQDYVIISADGLDYPYRKSKNTLTQDW